MGRKTWLSSGAISAPPILNSYGLMDTTLMKDLGSFNVLNVKPLAQRIWLNLPTLKSQSFDALNAVLGCLSIRSAIHAR
jgi:hypothetical protein